MSTLIKAKFIWANGVETIVDIDLNAKVSKYFQVGEVANQSSKDEIKYVSTPRHRKFLRMMDEMRETFGPIKSDSCYRTKSFNDGIKNADPKSRHLDGEAMDQWKGKAKLTPDLVNKTKAKWENLCIRNGEVGAINLYTDGFHFEIGSDISYGATGFKVRDYRGKQGDW